MRYVALAFILLAPTALAGQEDAAIQAAFKATAEQTGVAPMVRAWASGEVRRRGLKEEVAVAGVALRLVREKTLTLPVGRGCFVELSPRRAGVTLTF
jgi:hypothetical protein